MEKVFRITPKYDDTFELMRKVIEHFADFIKEKIELFEDDDYYKTDYLTR